MERKREKKKKNGGKRVREKTGWSLLLFVLNSFKQPLVLMATELSYSPTEFEVPGNSINGYSVCPGITRGRVIESNSHCST